MKIKLNGKDKEIAENSTIKDLIAEMEASLPKMFVVEQNLQIIYKEQYETQLIKEGDEIEVVVFTGGG